MLNRLICFHLSLPTALIYSVSLINIKKHLSMHHLQSLFNPRLKNGLTYISVFLVFTFYVQAVTIVFVTN